MRKRNIKSVAHWVIMVVLLLFPVTMVGISAFAHDETTNQVIYPYETNDVETVDDLVIGHIYKLNLTNSQLFQINDTDSQIFSTSLVGSQMSGYTLRYVADDDTLPYIRCFSDGVYMSQLSIVGNDEYKFAFSSGTPYSLTCYFLYQETRGTILFNANCILASDWLGEPILESETNSYKQEVNNWCNGFKNLPVNQWYGSLLNTIGVGQTDNSVMNVIYVYPLYVLWVYILDVIVDCFLVIINFGHNALHRLGGDNE